MSESVERVVSDSSSAGGARSDLSRYLWVPWEMTSAF